MKDGELKVFDFVRRLVDVYRGSRKKEMIDIMDLRLTHTYIISMYIIHIRASCVYKI